MDESTDSQMLMEESLLPDLDKFLKQFLLSDFSLLRPLPHRTGWSHDLRQYIRPTRPQDADGVDVSGGRR
jgi:hypothetical protein